MIMIIFCVFITYILYTHIHKETGTLYSLNISKYYNNFTYGTMVVTRTIKTENQENPQIYTNCKDKSKKILDYLNKFELTEISRKKAFKNRNTKPTNMISTIIFNQNLREGKDNIFSMITINFFDNSIIEIVPCFEDSQKDSQKDYKKSTTKYYKIDNNKIDFNYIEKILAN